MKKTAFLLGAAFCAAVSSVLDGEVVSFKDAAKIKSWDAWGDNAPPSASNAVAKVRKVRKEKPCVTWAKLNELNPGLKEIGRLAVRDSKDVKSPSRRRASTTSRGSTRRCARWRRWA